MQRIYRPWAAGRESQLFAQSSSPYCRSSSLLHRYVSVKRLPVSPRPDLVVLFPRRTFTKSCHDKHPNQAAQTNPEEDDEYDNPAQQYTSYKITSFPGRRSVTAEQYPALDDSVVEDSPDSQTSAKGVRVDVLHHRDDTALLGDSQRFPDNEDKSAAFDGSCPFQTSDHSLTTPPSNVPLVEIGPFQPIGNDAPEQDSLQISPSTDLALNRLWRAESRPGKIDLSYWDPFRGERKGTYAAQRKLGQESLSAGFRCNRGPRKLVANFVETVYPHISSTHGISDAAARRLLSHPVLAPVATNFDTILDMLSWSWVVVAPPALCVKRLVHLSRSEHGLVLPEVPQWLVLQLLRSNHVNSGDLVDLISLINQKLGVWDLKRSLMILIVRLLRHARLSNPACFSSIIELFIELLDHYFLPGSSPEDLRRLTQWCNRVLTLLASPTRSHPFKHVIVQQDAQLLLLHYMHDRSPPIPLNREGYRALANLQLMHAKTDVERMWANVQADTWPPWEQQHQMGVTSPPRESPGSTSRVNMVLYRMKEDGYSPHAYDEAIQILGGRDMDGSPTIQVRRASVSISLKTSWLPGPDRTQVWRSSQIWVARITATRTVREAWMGLCAYESSDEDIAHATPVYHAMFKKLWAGKVSARPGSGPLPGDGLEVFADPELMRDRVYVPEEPSSVPDLYARMTAKGIKPSGLLLRGLLFWESDLHTGLTYIEDSPIPPFIKWILKQPTVQSPADVAAALSRLHKDTRRAYIYLLARPHGLRNKPRPEFSSDGSETHLAGPAFALQVLQHGKFHESSVWSQYFAALGTHRHSSTKDRWRIGTKTVWRLMCDSYAFEKRNLDCTALPHVLSTACSIETRSDVIPGEMAYEPLEASMKFFMEAVSGVRAVQKDVHGHWTRFMHQVRPWLNSTPTADVVQDMAFLMVAVQRESMVQDILHLLHWACQHQQQLERVSTFSRRNLAALRVYLEGQWANLDPEFSDLGLEVRVADPDQLEKGKAMCRVLGGWANDYDVDRYLVSSKPLFTRLKKKLGSVGQTA